MSTIANLASGVRVLYVLTLLMLVGIGNHALVAQDGVCGVKVKAKDHPLFNDALTSYSQKQYGKSAQLFRKLAQRNSKVAAVQFWLGMNAVRDGFNVTGVRRYFSKCIELCPEYPHPLAHYYMALIYYTDERYEEAVDQLETYFQIANNNDDKEVVAVYEEASNYLYWSQFLADAHLNAVPFEPYVVKGLSSEHDEMMPYITCNGEEAFFLRRLPQKSEVTFYAREIEETMWQLCSSKLEDGTFSKGMPLPAPFNSGLPEGNVSLTADGNTLYYSVITSSGGYSNSDIYCVRRVNGKWKKAENLGPQVNGEHSWESQPSITPDGNTLYFASNRKGGLGGTDIWRCRKLKNGDWSRPENLGSAVNTRGNERCPFIHADGHTLYFASDGWQGFGGYDFYFTNVNDSDANRPVNLGLPINTEDNELSLGVMPNGREAYYASKPSGAKSSDVRMFDLYPAARGNAMTFHRFVVKGDILPQKTTVSYGRGMRANYTTDTCHGSISVMLPANESSVVAMIADGATPLVMRFDGGKRVGIDSLEDTVMLFPITTDTAYPMTIEFQPGDRLSEGDEAVVAAYVAYLLDHPQLHIEVACPRSTQAKAIVDYMLKMHLRRERLSYRGGTDVKRPQFILK